MLYNSGTTFAGGMVFDFTGDHAEHGASTVESHRQVGRFRIFVCPFLPLQ